MQISSRPALNPLILHNPSSTRTAEDKIEQQARGCSFVCPLSPAQQFRRDNISLAADFLQKQPAAVGWANRLFMAASQSLYAVCVRTQGAAPG